MIRSACAVMLLALVGAAGCVVIPVRECRAIAGRRITDEQTALIRVGVTTRRDVIRELGEPTMDFTERRIVAYGWEELSGYALWAIPGVPRAACGVEKVPRPYVLLIAFDGNDRVVRFESKARRPADTIQEHAVKWATREGVGLPAPRGAAATAPAGRSMLYVYRAGGWGDSPLTVPSVSVDGRVVAELRAGHYVAVGLSPGPHTVRVNPVPGRTGPLEPHQRAIRSIALQCLPDRGHYLEVKVRWGFGVLDPVLTMRPEAQGARALAGYQRVW